MVFKDSNALESVENSLASMLQAQYRGFDPTWLELTPIIPGDNVPRGSWDTGIQFHWSEELHMLKPIDLLFRHESMRAFVPSHAHAALGGAAAATRLFPALMSNSKVMSNIEMMPNSEMVGVPTADASTILPPLKARECSMDDGNSCTSDESSKTSASNGGNAEGAQHPSASLPMLSFASLYSQKACDPMVFIRMMQQAVAAANPNRQQSQNNDSGEKPVNSLTPLSIPPTTMPPALEGSSAASPMTPTTNAFPLPVTTAAAGLQLPPSQFLVPPLPAPNLPNFPPVSESSSDSPSSSRRRAASSSTPMEDDADAASSPSPDTSSSLHINLRKRKPNQRKSYYPEHDNEPQAQNPHSLQSAPRTSGSDSRRASVASSSGCRRSSAAPGSRRASVVSESDHLSTGLNGEAPIRKSRRTSTRSSPSAHAHYPTSSIPPPDYRLPQHIHPLATKSGHGLPNVGESASKDSHDALLPRSRREKTTDVASSLHFSPLQCPRPESLALPLALRLPSSNITQPPVAPSRNGHLVNSQSAQRKSSSGGSPKKGTLASMEFSFRLLLMWCRRWKR